jgi:hypothetical protein
LAEAKDLEKKRQSLLNKDIGSTNPYIKINISCSRRKCNGRNVVFFSSVDIYSFNKKNFFKKFKKQEMGIRARDFKTIMR